VNGKILHRDISENNIIITDPGEADGFAGMLISLKLAKELSSGSSGARHRKGTMQFMAIEVLLGYSHTYRHDLESFLYVLLWICARHGRDFIQNPKGQPKGTMLTGCYTGSYKEIARE
jgi:serine/threonine protein kinase